MGYLGKWFLMQKYKFSFMIAREGEDIKYSKMERLCGKNDFFFNFLFREMTFNIRPGILSFVDSFDFVSFCDLHSLGWCLFARVIASTDKRML